MAEPQTPLTLVDWLDDLTVRFLLNLPHSELTSIPRLCFQVEEAQWFYEDFVRPAVAASGAPPLPSLSLRQFFLLLCQHCPLLNGYTDAQHLAAFEEFLAYKVRVPVRGAILLDRKMEKVILVRGWKKGASWSFPRGKINKDEKDLDCAIREVWEETGYDLRESGVVPKNDQDAKYIDISMREQHVRLFVFRDVPEDTHFEPRTRKEIGKISWYSIRDLPGFKKNKGHGQTPDAANTNKFYMVAPFLGPLKKWINAQRKTDAAQAHTRASSHGHPQQMATEDEGEEVEEQTSGLNTVVDSKSEELKRLLSIGAATVQPAPVQQANNLLAMLQGGSNPTNNGVLPRTPFDQVGQTPPQPDTPQPHHPRHPSMGNQGPPPAFFSPRSRVQEEQQPNHPLQTPGIFGPGVAGFPHNQQPGFLNMPPSYTQQQQLQRGPILPGSMHGTRFPSQGAIPFEGHRRQPMQPPQMAPQVPLQMRPQMQQHFQTPPSNVFMAQGPQSAIGSGPAIPNASQLPPPKLNAHSMKLLDAFKSSGKATGSSAAPSQTQRPASTHQTALLDLFKKPSDTQVPAAQEAPVPPAEPLASPALAETIGKPMKTRGKPSTLSEITRTLPSKLKPKAPPLASSHAQDVQIRQQMPERPTSGQLQPSTNQQNARPPPRAESLETHPSPNVIAQPPPQKRTQTPPKSKHSHGSNFAPKPETAKSVQSGAPNPSITILTRPTSSRGVMSPAPASPLRNETPKSVFQPQLLRRPKVTEPSMPTPESTEVEVEAQKRTSNGADKKDQLLALFGKTVASAGLPAPAQPEPASIERKPNQPANSKNNPLGLSIPSQSPAQQPKASAQPPPAPRIEPEHNRAPQSTRPAAPSRQQSLLLGLLNKPSTGGPATSPNTPISPFTLGTPAARNGPGLGPGPADDQARSRLGSVASVTSSGSNGRSGGAETPKEAREFLLGFLNDVVQKEGRRGAGTPRS